jgi:hypothetical protein
MAHDALDVIAESYKSLALSQRLALRLHGLAFLMLGLALLVLGWVAYQQIQVQSVLRQHTDTLTVQTQALQVLLQRGAGH